MRRSRAVTVAAVVLAMVATPTAAGAGGGGGGGGGVRTVAEGLDGPRQLNTYTHGKLVVAESDSGEVSSVDPRSGRVRVLLSGLPGPQGVDYDDGRLFVALGEQEERAEDTPRGSTVIEAKKNGRIVNEYDLLEYELRKNPDGQRQFDKKGVQLDTLSNPFAVHVQDRRILVADAGANAVLSIDRRSGKIRTFFVPPLVSPKEVKACRDANLEQGIKGCDPVPTGVTEGKNGLIYVSTLGAEVEGAARVYVLTKKGEVVRVYKNLTGLTGIAVDHRGNIYVSELFAGVAEPAGPPPYPEDLVATAGQIVKIERDGDREYAQVTLPTGLEVMHGKLYASAWSLAGFLLAEAGRGEVVRVGARAFD